MKTGRWVCLVLVITLLAPACGGNSEVVTFDSPGGHLAALRERFEDTYRARYGHSNPDASLETVNLRLTALGDVGRPLLQPNYRPDHPSDAPSKTTPVLFATGSYPTSRFHREYLVPGCAIEGPAIVEEATATTVIPPKAPPPSTSTAA